MMRLRLAGLVAAALAVVPLTAAASDQDDALRLAERVASRGQYQDAVVTLHAPPKNLPASIPLPKATLLGSVVETIRQQSFMSAGGRTTAGTTSPVTQPMTLYYDAPAGRDAVLAAYDAALRQAGWKAPPESRRQFPNLQSGGFAFSALSETKRWCSADAHSSITVVNGKEPAAFDVYYMSGSPGVDLQCGEGPSPFDAFMQRSPLPTFTAPSGVTITSSGPASDGSTTGARIESALGLTAVFDGFAKQLRDAGWASASASISTPATRTQTFKKTVDGTAYVTLLAVYALDATHFVALADVSNVRE